MTLQDSANTHVPDAGAATTPAGDRWSDLIQIDRIHRTLYTDAAVFDEEMVKVFGGRSWVYLAHESQVPEPNSFLSVRMGLRPVIVTRDRAGELHAVFNRCAHRAATICREESGTAKSFQCPYHGWTFRNTGELVGVPWAQGYANLDKSKFGLTVVTRVESYRGFIFGTMNASAPSVEDWLGHAKPWLDYWIDRSPTSEVFVRSGAYRMGYKGNWKLAFDNAGDGYHPSFSHRSLLEMASRMGDAKDMSYFGKTPDDGSMKVYSLGNGHSVIDQRPVYEGPGSFWNNQRPQPGREKFEESIRAQHGDDADRLLDLAIGAQINLSIFPNLLLIGNQIQVVEPMAVDRTQLTWHATTIGGVPDAVNTMRMRTQEDFPAFGEPDDQANFEEAQRGLAAPEAEWIYMNRGLGVADWQSLKEDGVIVTAVTDELHMRSYYEEWQRRMEGQNR
ncbi:MULTISPECIES: aromatic ring-hydroxylating dioxygenase subunit alpha [Rhodococcus]|uniref:Aniline dioxygenase n=1 Tax=Rhodococcus sp. AN-22 TaxID=200251 RepID=C0STT5_9NOCA|nr:MULTISPECIES: aromatic ring-hydroxylating dioxygenase subunit alpha [Rhodococcus]UTT51088.1 aromatic ring-hydroxylating dioxygenase subunit alpha [Rhodococcus gordoniae]BAH56716.1 large subunit of aniline dioxygenase [Rhodococcus sp. AN-22]BAI63575.1 aniline dioxygenase [Rhodococcus sp. AN-22]